MPSPVGHMLAGTAVGLWLAPRPLPSRATERVLAACALLAAAPDLDLLVPGAHRTFTHSLAAVAVAALLSAGAARVALPAQYWRIALACGLAYASHLVMDFFGDDQGNPAGIQVLWPIRVWYISDLTLFFGTVREDIFSVASIAANTRAVVWESVVFGSLLWWVRYRRRREIRAAGRP